MKYELLYINVRQKSDYYTTTLKVKKKPIMKIFV